MTRKRSTSRAGLITGAFPHRASAASDPRGHHWQDSTHITYGVLTPGILTRHVQRIGRELAAGKPGEQTVLDASGLALGDIHEVELDPSLVFGLGARGAVNAIGRSLEPLYGTRWPLAGMLFVRVRPATRTID